MINSHSVQREVMVDPLSPDNPLACGCDITWLILDDEVNRADYKLFVSDVLNGFILYILTLPEISSDW